MVEIKIFLNKVLKEFQKDRFYYIFLFLILFWGSFLRLYKISEYMVFLGDEGRDVIVVRRFLLKGDLMFVGPGTSVGNMYLGPLYYYLISPFLLLFNFSPVGPAFMVAVLGVATIYLVAYLTRLWFGKNGSLLSAFLYAISPTVIVYSRSSWNPNIMPFFSLLVVFCLWKIWYEKKFSYFLYLGVFMAFVLQSHYLGLLLTPLIFLFSFFTFWEIYTKKEVEKIKLFFKEVFLGGFLFFVLMSPLIVFDLKHKWRNFLSFYSFFSNRQTTISAKFWTAFPKMPLIFYNSIQKLIAGYSKAGSILFFVFLAVSSFYLFLKKKILKDRERNAFLLLFFWLFFGFMGLGLYKQEIYDHYYGFFFTAPFILFGGLAEKIIEDKGYFSLFIFSVFGILVFYNLLNNPLRLPPNRHLSRTNAIVDSIIQKAGGERFNFAVIAERNYEGAYQYFFELKNAPFVVIDPQKSETITDKLFVICEYEDKQKCQPTSNPKAEVANFGWSKIQDVWDVEGIRVFLLVHNYP